MIPPVTAEGRVHLMPEYLVVCAWRSIKEVSLLLGLITSTAPVSEVTDPANEVADPDIEANTNSSSDGLISVELVSERCTVLCCIQLEVTGIRTYVIKCLIHYTVNRQRQVGPSMAS